MLVTKNINPLMTTRYLVVLPTEFNIEPFQVSKVQLPSITTRKSFFSSVIWGYSDLELELMVENTDLIKKLTGRNDKFDLRVELLDPIGMVSGQYIITGFIKTISLGSLEYGSEDIYKLKISFSVDTFTT